MTRPIKSSRISLSSFHLYSFMPRIQVTHCGPYIGRTEIRRRASLTVIPAASIREMTRELHRSRRMLMADQNAPQMQATLGLTGLTSNAMALIAPDRKSTRLNYSHLVI